MLDKEAWRTASAELIEDPEVRDALSVYLVNELYDDALVAPANRDTGHHVWMISSSILGQIGWAAILNGVIGLLRAVFAGPTAAATSARRRTAGVLNGRPGIVWAVVAGVFLLVVLWGPTHALRTLWGVTLLGALLAAGIVALRRQTLSEFPDAGADGGGAAAPVLS